MDLQDYYFKMPLKTEPIIDDTTLRDGIQMPGLAAGPKDAAKIAQLLSDIGVERIELFHYQEPDKKAAKLIQDLKLRSAASPRGAVQSERGHRQRSRLRLQGSRHLTPRFRHTLQGEMA